MVVEAGGGGGCGYCQCHDVFCSACPRHQPTEVQHLTWADRDAVDAHLTALSRLTSLLSLNLQFNTITVIPPALPASLRLLDLSHNQVASLAGVECLVNLRVFRCSFNGVTDLSPLRPLQCLEELWIDHNLVELEHMVDLEDRRLSRLVHLVAHNNPAASHPHYREVVVSLVGSSLKTLDGRTMAMAPNELVGPRSFGHTPSGKRVLAKIRASSTASHYRKAPTTTVIAARLEPSLTNDDNGATSTSTDAYGAASTTNRTKSYTTSITGIATCQPSGSDDDLNKLTIPAQPAAAFDLTNTLINRPSVRPPPPRRRRPAGGARPVAPSTSSCCQEVFYSKEETCVLIGGSFSSSPLALIVREDGSGVAKYPNKANTLAITADRVASPRGGVAAAFTLFGHYDNGKIAVSLDANGNLAVNSSKGRTLLSTNAKGGGFLMDDLGTITRCWEPPPSAQQEDQDQEGNEAPIALKLSRHLGLRFNPNDKEVVLSFSCGGVRATFSSRNGCIIVKQARPQPQPRPLVLEALGNEAGVGLCDDDAVASQQELRAMIKDSNVGLDETLALIKDMKEKSK